MALRDQFSDDLKAAMRAGDKRRVSTIRLITSALKDRDIEARGLGKDALGDEDILGVLQKMVKQRQESLRIYEENNREDLASQEREEIEIINGFLPQQMNDDEVSTAITAAIAETGAASVKDMGKVMAALKEKFTGRMDFGKASAGIKAKLG